MWSARIVPAHFWIGEYTVRGIGISHGTCHFSPMGSTNANEAALVKLPGREVPHRATVAAARGSRLRQLAGGGFSGKGH